MILGSAEIGVVSPHGNMNPINKANSANCAIHRTLWKPTRRSFFLHPAQRCSSAQQCMRPQSPVRFDNFAKAAIIPRQIQKPVRTCAAPSRLKHCSSYCACLRNSARFAYSVTAPRSEQNRTGSCTIFQLFLLKKLFAKWSTTNTLERTVP